MRPACHWGILSTDILMSHETCLSSGHPLDRHTYESWDLLVIGASSRPTYLWVMRPACHRGILSTDILMSHETCLSSGHPLDRHTYESWDLLVIGASSRPTYLWVMRPACHRGILSTDILMSHETCLSSGHPLDRHTYESWDLLVIGASSRPTYLWVMRPACHRGILSTDILMSHETCLSSGHPLDRHTYESWDLLVIGASSRPTYLWVMRPACQGHPLDRHTYESWDLLVIGASSRPTYLSRSSWLISYVIGASSRPTYLWVMRPACHRGILSTDILMSHETCLSFGASSRPTYLWVMRPACHRGILSTDILMSHETCIVIGASSRPTYLWVMRPACHRGILSTDILMSHETCLSSGHPLDRHTYESWDLLVIGASSRPTYLWVMRPACHRGILSTDILMSHETCLSSGHPLDRHTYESWDLLVIREHEIPISTDILMSHEMLVRGILSTDILMSHETCLSSGHPLDRHTYESWDLLVIGSIPRPTYLWVMRPACHRGILSTDILMSHETCLSSGHPLDRHTYESWDLLRSIEASSRPTYLWVMRPACHGASSRPTYLWVMRPACHWGILSTDILMSHETCLSFGASSRPTYLWVMRPACHRGILSTDILMSHETCLSSGHPLDRHTYESWDLLVIGASSRPTYLWVMRPACRSEACPRSTDILMSHETCLSSGHPLDRHTYESWDLLVIGASSRPTYLWVMRPACHRGILSTDILMSHETCLSSGHPLDRHTYESWDLLVIGASSRPTYLWVMRPACHWGILSTDILMSHETCLSLGHPLDRHTYESWDLLVIGASSRPTYLWVMRPACHWGILSTDILMSHETCLSLGHLLDRHTYESWDLLVIGASSRPTYLWVMRPACHRGILSTDILMSHETCLSSGHPLDRHTYESWDLLVMSGHPLDRHTYESWDLLVIGASSRPTYLWVMRPACHGASSRPTYLWVMRPACHRGILSTDIAGLMTHEYLLVIGASSRPTYLWVMRPACHWGILSTDILMSHETHKLCRSMRSCLSTDILMSHETCLSLGHPLDRHTYESWDLLVIGASRPTYLWVMRPACHVGHPLDRHTYESWDLLVIGASRSTDILMSHETCLSSGHPLDRHTYESWDLLVIGASSRPTYLWVMRPACHWGILSTDILMSHETCLSLGHPLDRHTYESWDLLVIGASSRPTYLWVMRLMLCHRGILSTDILHESWDLLVIGASSRPTYLWVMRPACHWGILSTDILMSHETCLSLGHPLDRHTGSWVMRPACQGHPLDRHTYESWDLLVIKGHPRSTDILMSHETCLSSGHPLDRHTYESWDLLVIGASSRRHTYESWDLLVSVERMPRWQAGLMTHKYVGRQGHPLDRHTYESWDLLVIGASSRPTYLWVMRPACQWQAGLMTHKYVGRQDAPMTSRSHDKNSLWRNHPLTKSTHRTNTYYKNNHQTIKMGACF